MDSFELAVRTTLHQTWEQIEEGVNSSAQVLSGRAGSSVAEDVILAEMEKITPEKLESLKTTINQELTVEDNPYRFAGYRYRSKVGNQEANSRSLEDVVVLLKRDQKIFDAYINIKVSNGKKGQADNSCSWKAAAYTLYGKLNVIRRDLFLKIEEDFSDDESHNYFFWVILKNENATQLTHGHVNSLLSIDPDKGMRFNINQPFPVQIAHGIDASSGDSPHFQLSLYERRNRFHSWLVMKMAEKYRGLTSTAITALHNHSTVNDYADYQALLRSQNADIAKLTALVIKMAQERMQQKLCDEGIPYDAITVEDETIHVTYAGQTILSCPLDDI